MTTNLDNLEEIAAESDRRVIERHGVDEQRQKLVKGAEQLAEITGVDMLAAAGLIDDHRTWVARARQDPQAVYDYASAKGIGEAEALRDLTDTRAAVQRLYADGDAIAAKKKEGS